MKKMTMKTIQTMFTMLKIYYYLAPSRILEMGDEEEELATELS